MAANRFKEFRREILYWLAVFLLTALKCMPDWLAPRLGNWLARRASAFATRDRDRARENLRRAFGDALDDRSRDRIITNMFGHWGRCLGEYMGLPRRSESWFRDFASFEGWEKIEAILEEGRGVFLLTPHFGFWELTAARIAYDMPIASISREFDETRYHDIVSRHRQSLDINVIYQHEPMTKVLRWLKSNKAAGTLPDQDLPQYPGVFMTFFGRSAYTATGVSLIAYIARCPIVTLFAVREGYRQRIVFDEVIRHDRSLKRDEAVLEATKAWTLSFQRMIARHPHLWVWHHQRWRTTPENIEAARDKIRRRQARNQAESGN